MRQALAPGIGFLALNASENGERGRVGTGVGGAAAREDPPAEQSRSIWDLAGPPARSWQKLALL